ncbi:MAG: hypothetical protein JW737_08945 [Acidobacteria bacterium]|nr:hypothetical protein [Acidobacteriota bacterium]
MTYKRIFLLGFIILFVFTSLNLSAEKVDNQKLQNLEAFAKLYGYVRFFHPSDNAADVNWNKFAILGAAEVTKAKNTDELKIILQKLFIPIAPTIQIFKTGAEKPVPPKNPESTEGLNLIAWQHRGVELSSNAAYNIYKSMRTYRASEQNIINDQLFTFIEPELIKGKDIKLVFKARLITGDDKTYAKGYLKQFFRNLSSKYNSSKEIISSEWKDYEFTISPDKGFLYLQLGFIIVGNGEFQIDDVRLFDVNENGETAPVEIYNGDFEKPLETMKDKWELGDKRFDIQIKDKSEKDNNKIISVKTLPEYIPGSLFNSMPAPGEYFIKPLNASLSCLVPLTLWSRDGTTIDETDSTVHTKLIEALAKIDLKTTDASSEAIRFADVVIMWNVLQHFYPYFDVVGTDWEKVLPEMLSKAMQDKNGEDFLYTILAAVEKLRDGHGNVSHRLYFRKYCLPFIADIIEGQAVIVQVGDTQDLKVGDIILAIDGEIGMERFDHLIKYISGSPQWKKFKAARWYYNYVSEPGAVKMKIKRGDEIKELQITPYELNPSTRPIRMETRKTGKLTDDIYYVNLGNTPMPEIEKILPELAKAKGIVFDLRGYPSGNHNIISNLIDKPVQSPIWNVPKIIYPDREKIVGWDQSGRWDLYPKEPKLKGKIIFLINANAISYSESFMGIIENYKLAEIIGEQTAGTNGNVNTFSLPGGYYVTWTGMKVLKHDGSQHHLIGIKPTIPLSRTIKAVREGRDEVLEKAIEVINSKK